MLTDQPALLALQFAVAAFVPDGGLPLGQCDDLILAARKFARFLQGPVTLMLTPSKITFDLDAPDGPGVPTVMEGNAVQLTDKQGVVLTLAEADSLGQPVTGDNVSYSVDDPGVVTVTPSADGASVTCAATLFTDQVNGKLGTATVTATDSTVSPPLTGTFALNVVASAAATMTLNAGAPFDLTSPAPSA